MTTPVTTEPKKFVRDYQIKDDSGNPIGPPQHFEADTREELLDLIESAHKNAAKEMYKEKKARKLGDLITPDPDKPIKRYERKILSADERTRIAAGIKDPQTSTEATKTLVEAELGIPFEDIREAIQYVDIQKRIQNAQIQTDKFLSNHPEYVQCDSNQELILKWLEKKNYAVTEKNLELAYENLDDLLTKQAPVRPTPQVSVVATPTEQVIPAPPQPEAIPTAVTPAPAITEPPAEVRPKQSSSGLGRDNGAATTPAEPPKAKGITRADIAQMNSTVFNEKLKDPAFRKMVDEMKS